MIGYVTLGTNDLQRAAGFYDKLMAELDAKRLWDFGGGIAWGTSQDKPSLAIMNPYDKNAATVGNGVMVGLLADSRETVDRVYRKALELGGKDAGPAGPRGDTFYVGYFRDLDGNKLCVFKAG
jgi:predicted lactoylglutathione lyase